MSTVKQIDNDTMLISTSEFEIEKNVHIDKRGKIELILGPVLSGKSMELIRLLRRYNFKRKKSILICYEQNDKSEYESIDNIEYLSVKNDNLSFLKSDLHKYDIIGIDNGHLFKDINEISEYLVLIGKIVIISSLNGNCNREPYNHISKLISNSDSIQNISAICFYCNEDANYTLNFQKEKESFKLYPSCRSCHNYFTEKNKELLDIADKLTIDKEVFNKLKKKSIFTLEGNIGAGKSYLLEIIKQFDDVYIIEEPVNEWQNINGHNLLDKFYQQPSRWRFSFQIYIFYTKIKALFDAANSDKKIILMERSFDFDNIFFYLAAKSNLISEMEVEMFKNINKLFDNYIFPKINGFIYLDTPVHECINRIKKRNRTEETGIPEDYLNNLKISFDDVINKATCSKLIINGEYNVNSDIHKITNEISTFIRKV